jgi:pyruvate kinase
MTNIDYIYKKQRAYTLLGPKWWNVLVLKKMFNEGMHMTCFNFSHGMYAYHQKTFKNLKLAMYNSQIVCGVL